MRMGHQSQGHTGDDGLRPRCMQHRLTDDDYMPQLRRLLAGAATERQVYDSLVHDVVAASANPLGLFQRSQQRCGMYFIEALYRTYAEQVVAGDRASLPSLGPLGYSRWVAWRCFGDAVRNRSVSFGRRVDDFIVRSRIDVIGHIGSGWRPLVLPQDPELLELLEGR